MTDDTYSDGTEHIEHETTQCPECSSERTRPLDIWVCFDCNLEWRVDTDTEREPMTDNEHYTDGTDRETVYVEEAPRRIFGNLLIDGCDGQCAYIYAGIEERCPNDAVAHTFLSSGKKVEMCAEHAREDVPEPPKTEQKELVTDGGTVEDDTERYSGVYH